MEWEHGIGNFKLYDDRDECIAFNGTLHRCRYSSHGYGCESTKDLYVRLRAAEIRADQKLIREFWNEYAGNS